MSQLRVAVATSNVTMMNRIIRPLMSAAEGKAADESWQGGGVGGVNMGGEGEGEGEGEGGGGNGTAGEAAAAAAAGLHKALCAAVRDMPRSLSEWGHGYCRTTLLQRTMLKAGWYGRLAASLDGPLVAIALVRAAERSGILTAADLTEPNAEVRCMTGMDSRTAGDTGGDSLRIHYTEPRMSVGQYSIVYLAVKTQHHGLVRELLVILLRLCSGDVNRLQAEVNKFSYPLPGELNTQQASQCSRGTALHCAAIMGNPIIVGELISFGALSDLMTLDSQRNSPLHLVARSIKSSSANHKDDEQKQHHVVHTLMKAGCASAQSLNAVQYTPLIVATRHGRTDLIEVLCQLGASPNFAPHGGSHPHWPALMHACHIGATGMVEALMVAGADPNMWYPSEHTELHNEKTGNTMIDHPVVMAVGSQSCLIHALISQEYSAVAALLRPQWGRTALAIRRSLAPAFLFCLAARRPKELSQVFNYVWKYHTLNKRSSGNMSSNMSDALGKMAEFDTRITFLREVTKLRDSPPVRESFNRHSFAIFACENCEGDTLGILAELSKMRRVLLKACRDIDGGAGSEDIPESGTEGVPTTREHHNSPRLSMSPLAKRARELRRHTNIVFDLTAAADGKTALHYACSHPEDQAEIVDLLLKDRVDVNAADSDGIQPLHLAAWQGHMRSCRLLLEEGANVASVTSWDVNLLPQEVAGLTPLHLAVYPDLAASLGAWRRHRRTTRKLNGSDSIVTMLLERQADSSRDDAMGRTPLYLAFKCRRAIKRDPTELLTREYGKPDVQVSRGEGCVCMCVFECVCADISIPPHYLNYVCAHNPDSP